MPSDAALPRHLPSRLLDPCPPLGRPRIDSDIDVVVNFVNVTAAAERFTRI
jgi:hypothetical protein